MFDEEPDAPLHGECAAEIHRLNTELARVTADMAALQAKAEHWRETALIAEGENARLRGELEALRLGPIEQSDGLVSGRDYIPLPG